MADNAVSRTTKQRIALGRKMAPALTKYGSALKITQMTGAQITAAVNALVASDNIYTNLRADRNPIYVSFHAADLALTKWMKAVRNVLKTHFGERYSVQWVQAGFINNTTQLPSKINDRLSLAEQMVAFLETKPDFQVDKLGVTPEIGTEKYAAANGAYETVDASGVSLKESDITNKATGAALVVLMTNLISFLRGSLSRTDPRWLEFGLDIPAISTTPAAPMNLTAMRTEDGKIVLGCDPTPLGKTFRWRMRSILGDGSYKLLGSSKNPAFVLADPDPEADLEFIVQAVNGGRQSVASESYILGALGAKKETIAKRQVAVSLPSLDGESHGNGNGNGHRSTAHAAQDR